MTTNEIIHTLRHGGLRVRTALWLLPPSELPNLPDHAARLGVGITLVDARQPIFEAIAPDQSYLRLSSLEITAALDALCQSNQMSDCLLVANCDLLLARLNHSDRQEFWETLYRGFPYRPRAILLVMPQWAEALLPQDLDKWKREGRLVP